jgi:hypothetical protein
MVCAFSGSVRDGKDWTRYSSTVRCEKTEPDSQAFANQKWFTNTAQLQAYATARPRSLRGRAVATGEVYCTVRVMAAECEMLTPAEVVPVAVMVTG